MIIKIIIKEIIMGDQSKGIIWGIKEYLLFYK